MLLLHSCWLCCSFEEGRINSVPNHGRLLLLLRSSQPQLARSIHHSRLNSQAHNSFRSISYFSHRHFSPPQTHTPFRCFSSPDLAADRTDLPDQISILSDIFSKPDKSSVDIRLDLESTDVAITHDLVLRASENQGFAPESALRLFDWVVENESERLSSKSYNLLLEILLENGSVNEFWETVDVIKKKG
ncbi:unnamed protein product [Cuscuta campestris]|uniref:Pentatricopeptide repeat-containing protein n=1 Tax=Cuscuta campestris TaxID=132261 RepID=A0A484MUZ8_9ASTE|nr:unnamed protein product [Cuscuta campestris]